MASMKDDLGKDVDATCEPGPVSEESSPGIAKAAPKFKRSRENVNSENIRKLLGAVEPRVAKVKTRSTSSAKAGSGSERSVAKVRTGRRSSSVKVGSVSETSVAKMDALSQDSVAKVGTVSESSAAKVKKVAKTSLSPPKKAIKRRVPPAKPGSKKVAKVKAGPSMQTLAPESGATPSVAKVKASKEVVAKVKAVQKRNLGKDKTLAQASVAKAKKGAKRKAASKKNITREEANAKRIAKAGTDTKRKGAKTETDAARKVMKGKAVAKKKLSKRKSGTPSAAKGKIGVKEVARAKAVAMKSKMVVRKRAKKPDNGRVWKAVPKTGLTADLEIERRFGNVIIAGVDEAGRGPLAGPVVAGAVIVDQENILPGIRDSKQMSKKDREDLYTKITSSYRWAVGIVSAATIDEINILEATKKACQLAVSSLGIRPEAVLVDGNMKFADERFISLIKGDDKSMSIAAASIVAKVTRDRIMTELAQEFPAYHWDKNSGYGTKLHVDAIMKHGRTAHHRTSFRLKGIDEEPETQ